MPRQLCRDEYTVGWVCALPVELAAAQEMLDEEHLDLQPDPADNDENLYALGSIGGHNVAIVCLPAGRIGNNPAAAVATRMRATFKSIRFGLMVGIGGGVPSAEADIRLGDVVVSQPHGTFSGVVQYDMGKATPSGFERTGSLNSPPQMLLAAIGRVRANEMRRRGKLAEHVSKLERMAKFQRVKAGPDVLFDAAYDHEGGQTCDGCSTDRQAARQPRESEEEVMVHYGTIASGNQVMRSAAERDKVSAELGGILCFEMEAAGLMNSFPCLVIRGICDYADSHKNKRWQAYAAATAAAYGREVLSVIPPAEVAKAHTVEETVRGASKRFCITVLSRKAEHIDLFLCGPDGRVYTLWWEQNGGWSPSHTNLEGDFPPGAKVTAVSKAAEKLDLFACDINGNISTSWWHVPEMIVPFIQWTTWSPWEKVGERFYGGAEVAATSRGQHVLDLFSYAEDGQINALQWTKEGGWSKDTYGESPPRNPQGFPVGAHITVTARTQQHMNLFVCDADGNIKTLGWSSVGGWTDWELIGRQFLNDTEIAVIVPNVDTIEIFARRPNGQVYTTNWTAGSGWKHIWNQISLGAGIRAESKVTVTKLSSEVLQLFVHGSDGFVHTCWRSGLLAKWGTWRSIRMQKFLGLVDITAVTRMGARAVDLFVSNNKGQRVTVWWTRGSKSNWEEWRTLQLPSVFNW